MTGDAILIAGGYGIVGRRIAAQLAPDFPGRVIVAGRNMASAQTAAAGLGHGVRGRRIDIADPPSIAEALGDVGTVVSCIDQPGRALLWAAVERGLRYTDITPHLTQLGFGVAYERIEAAARESGARLVLGTGIVPGISNVMVRALVDILGGADSIETALLLSAGDVTGPASFAYFVQELSMPFTVRADGRDRPARPLTYPSPIDFPAPFGRREAWLFPFSDQVLYPRTLGAATVRTRLALQPPWLARLLAVLAQTRTSGILENDVVRRRVTARAQSVRETSVGPRFALAVEVARAGRSRRASLIGASQSDAAATGAAETARLLIGEQAPPPGAWMPEQVVDPRPFLVRLAARGLKVEFLV